MRTRCFVLCTFLFAAPAWAQHDDTAPIAKPILKARAAKPVIMADGTAKPNRQWELMQMNF